MQNQYGTSFMSNDVATDGTSVQTNVAPFDYKSISLGHQLFVLQVNANVPGGREFVSPNAEQMKAFFNKEARTITYPYFVRIWATETGKACTNPERINSTDIIKSVVAAYKDLRGNGIYSIGTWGVMWRNPENVGRSNLYGYLLPTYKGGVVMAGQELGVARSNALRYLVPIKHLGSKITNSERFEAGEPLVNDDLALYKEAKALFAQGQMTKEALEDIADTEFHAQHAWNRYNIIVNLIAGGCVDLFVNQWNWSYVRDMLLVADIVEGNPELSTKMAFDAINAKAKSREIYNDLKETPELKTVGMPAVVHAWGSADLVTPEDIASLKPGDIVTLHDGRYNASRLNKGAGQFWPADKAEQIALLSTLSHESVKEPTIRIVRMS